MGASYDLLRIRRLLERHPDCDVWVVSNTLDASKYFWGTLNDVHLKTKQKPRFISSDPYSLDGLNPHNAIIIKYGKWWENKNSTKLIQHFSKLAKYVLPVTHIPTSTSEGGEENA